MSPNIGMPHVLNELSGPQKLVETGVHRRRQEIKTDHDAEAKGQGAFIAAANTMAAFEHHSEEGWQDGQSPTW